MTLKANFHTHTTFCDGKNTPEEMVQQAILLGFTQLGFSGHMDADIHMDLPAYLTEIHRLQGVYQDQLEILCGIELDNLYDPACAKDAEYVIGSTHFLDLPSEIPISVDNSSQMLEKLCREFFGGDYYRLSKAYYELEAQIADRIPCTFIGHFDLVTRFNDQTPFLEESDPRYYKPALEAMEVLVKKDLPFEINCGAVNRNRKKEFYPNSFLLKHLREMGGRILISSDAHQKELLNGAFDQAVEAAVSCGFTHTNILTRKGNGQVHFEEIPLR